MRFPQPVKKSICFTDFTGALLFTRHGRGREHPNCQLFVRFLPNLLEYDLLQVAMHL